MAFFDFFSEIDYVLITGIIIYIVISFILWKKQIKILGFQIFPFGVSTTHLNHFIDVISRRYRRLWVGVSNLSFLLFGLISLSVFPILVIILIGSMVQFNFISGPIKPIYTIIKSNIAFDFKDIWFWIIAVTSIFLHELFHGFTARVNDIDVENVGAFAIPNILYGGYVKIDYFGLFYSDKLNEEKPDLSATEAQIKEYPELSIQEYDTNVLSEPVESLPDNVQKSTEIDIKRIHEISDDEFIKNFEKRRRMGKSISAGLFANFILIFVAAIILAQFSPFLSNKIILLLRFIIGANLFLIAFNLLPFGFSDGGKLMKVKLIDIFPGERGVKISDSITRLFYYVLIFFLIT